uniref:Craniofacial development protein 2-like n=1 Tax=Diabrotica virgifera virgifera TaxID=50390 RepID=A0A6P7F0X3_DIAVI
MLCVYALQTGLGENERRAFYDQLGEVLSDIPSKEKVIIGGDFNAHVGQSKAEYEAIHGGLGFGTTNEAGDDMLEFATALDMAIVNTFFKKRETQLITYKSGQHQSQIDYFMIRKEDIRECKDCKVIVSETVSQQHKLLVLDFEVKSETKPKYRKGPQK